ncbi:MAG: hypothetical protein LBH24_00920 [Clostridiales bacterium]|jgi:hypothetical protein|nr:hypothetical protein [Clostridiales bacterium]
MRTNSILTCLREDNTVSEIKLLLSADVEKKRVVLLLEGEDDVKLFKFLVKSNVTLIKAYGASSSIDSLIPQYFSNTPRVIAVRDRDYQRVKRHDKIFYCDYSCAEMMMVSDDETFDKLSTNHYRGKLEPAALRLRVFESLYYISVIRKCSALGKWGVKVSETDLSAVVSPRRTADSAEAVEFVNRYNRHNPIDGLRAAHIAQFTDTYDLREYLYLTNGHDFVEAFCVYCTESASNNVKKRLNEKVISAALRLSYSRASFKKTKLYKALKSYAAAHNLILV